MSFPFYELLFGTFSILMNSINEKFIEIDKEQTEFPNYNYYGLPTIQDYDFIIVGGGTSGCLLANRLSDKFTVLLIEAGGNPLPMTYVPGNWLEVYMDNTIVEKWKSVKQSGSCLATDGICEIGYAKSLGGSSVINAMIYNRGSPYDYVNWAKIVKDETWNYENLIPLFKMHENFIGENNDHLGHGGELNITKKETILNEQEMIWNEAWFKGGTELGFEQFENPNMPQKEGFVSISQANLNGVRSNAYDAFIKPIESRETLTISRYSKAKKIEIDENGKAVGVLFERHGINQYARANKEIILSAGTMNSPLILMNSGIGPEDQLNLAEIPVKANLPVGQFWQDHPIAYMTASLDKPNYENLDENDIHNYIHNQTGILSNVMGNIAQAFILTDTAKKADHDKNWPDVQLLIHFYNKEILKNVGNLLGILVSTGTVQSVGTLSLNTTHPSEQLIWDPNYFGEERDFNAIVDGLELCVKLLETDGFKALGAKIEPNIPGCENLDLKSREYWACFARYNTLTHWHAIGSVRMGAEDDPKAVVDSKLRVKGIGGLRVIDNSIQPSVTNGNTHAPAYVIGEKGAKMIIEEYAQ